MSISQHAPGGRGRFDGLPTGEVLAELRSDLATIRDLEVDQFRAILAWADANTVTDETLAATAWAGFCDTGMPIAGPGTPLVGEFALAELIGVLGRTPEGGRSYVGKCLELGWRLPQIRDRVLDGRVRLWKALEVADLTRTLPLEAAGFVDRNLAFALGSCTFAQIRRLVDEAIVRFDPETAEKDRLNAADLRHFDIRTDQTTIHGLVQVDGLLDAADAIDLDAAIGRRATALGVLGCVESLDVRRSLAAGELARHDLTLDLETVDETTGEITTLAPGRKIVLHVHLTDAALTGTASGSAGVVGRCEETRSPIVAAQIRDWCATPGTSVLVRPVIDLADHVPVDSYEIPDRLRERVVLRDHHCGFPYCGRQARACDLDHHQPHGEGGVTCPCNLVPLCRKHHRLKTHSNQLTGWNYTIIEPGTYLWRSPHGHTWLVNHHGTRDLDQGCPPEHDRPPD